MMKAIAAVVVVLGTFMTSGGTPHAPKTRAPTFEPYRVSWSELREDLRHRKASRRTFGMPKKSFVKLADLQRTLQKNESFGSEYDTIRVRHVFYACISSHS